MANKSVYEMPDLRLREAIAMYLFGQIFTDDNLKSIAILGQSQWYKYPHKGTYTRVGSHITISMPGREAQTFG